MSQLILPLDHRQALGREDFLVSACNQAAVSWIDQWPDWPGRTLLLYGPEGCGKSHLTQVYLARSGAVSLSAKTLSDVREEPPRFIALEDAPVREAGEEGLFHLINWVRECEGSLLITSRTPVAEWDIKLKDLASRMGAMTAVRIDVPDDMLLNSILLKLFDDRQLEISPAVINFLSARMERSFAAAKYWVQRIDEAALAQKKAITVPFVRALMDD